MEIDRAVAAHAHPQCHALFKVDGDDSVFEVEDRRYPLTTETVVLVNAWQRHAYPFAPGPLGRSLVLALYVEPRWMRSVDASFRTSARKDFFREPCAVLPAEIRRQVLDLADEMAAARRDSGRAFGLLERIMVQLTGRFSRNRELPRWAHDISSTIGDHRIRKALSIIAERAATRLDLGAVAREIAMSRPHFFEVFHDSVGVTPNVFRNVVRMERAYGSLFETSLPVNLIGAGLGFSVHADFTRFFRMNHGIPPEAYRRAAWRLS